MKKLLFLALLLGSTLLACNRTNGSEPSPVDPDAVPLAGYSNRVILDWNEMAFQAMGGTAYQHSLLAARINAMTHLAMHDALNAVAPRYQTYAFQSTDASANPVAAAASAAHRVLVASFPDKKPMLDSALTQSLAGVGKGDALDRGLALGTQAAEAILARRGTDGALQNPIASLDPSATPGVYQVVPPFDFVFAPFWKTMLPFGLQRPDQFRVLPQPALTSAAYAQAFQEVQRMGSKTSQARTAEQTRYAKFWYEFSEIGWNRIARTAATDRKLDLLGTARLFALLNIALTDAYTAGWDAKYHYNFWRPFTAIRSAATDGNAATAPDAAWEPLLPTPPVPDYPSTHSALGNAGATVLAHVLGDKTAFTVTSFTADSPGGTRSFGGFSQAAKENADSRVMAGLHFRFACDAGLSLGENVGRWTVDNHLKPRTKAAK